MPSQKNVKLSPRQHSILTYTSTTTWQSIGLSLPNRPKRWSSVGAPAAKSNPIQTPNVKRAQAVGITDKGHVPGVGG